MARSKTPPPNTTDEERAKSKDFGALRGLVPFIKPYTALLVAAVFCADLDGGDQFGVAAGGAPRGG